MNPKNLIPPTLVALAVACLTGASPAPAEIASSGAGGFVTKSSVMVAATPADAYERFLKIGSWWNLEHTYTQDGRNLSLKAEPGGCFCESLKDGGFIEHLRVVLASPGKVLRLQGGLGPLQDIGATGVLSVAFDGAGAQTRVTFTYAVIGYLPGKGLGELAAPVDSVLADQLDHYKKAAEST